MRYLILPLCLALLLTGCGRGKKEEGDPTGKEVAEGKDKGKGKESSPRAGELPKGFPSELPYYPSAKLMQRVEVGNDLSLTLSTTDPASKVASFYEETFKKTGWTIGGRFDMDKAVTLVASKDDKKCGMSISQADDLTIIVMGLTSGDPFPEKKDGEEPKDKSPTGKLPRIGGLPLPKDFPDDIPLYENAKVTAAVNVPEARTLSLTTSDKAEKVVAYFEAAAKKLGWKQFAKTQDENQTTLGLEKEDRQMTISINPDEGETLIVVGVIKKGS